MLTLNMIVKDEAATLPACLKSVKDWVDDIIIIDTGSTDDTVALAKQLGATVKTFDWCDDFSAARNYALSHVTSPWTLWLDADDLVHNPELLPQLIQQAEQEQADAIWSIYEQDATCFQRRLHLFKTERYHWEGVVHESPQPRYEDCASLLSELRVIHRKPPERGPEAARKYLDILLAKDPDNWLGLAESYKYLACNPDDPEKVVEYLQAADRNYLKAFEWEGTNEPTKYVCLFNLARICLDFVRWEGRAVNLAKRYAQAGIAMAPERAECYVPFGQACHMEGDTNSAYTAYERAMKLTPPVDDVGLVYHDFYTTVPENLMKALKVEIQKELEERAIDESLMRPGMIQTL